MSEISNSDQNKKAPDACNCSGKIAELQSIVEQLNKKLESIKIAELQSKVEQSNKQLESLELVVNDLLEAKEKSSAQKTAAVPAGGLKGHLFKNGKEEFRLKYPSFVFEGKEVTEDDLLIDLELQKKVFKQSPGLFVKS